MIGQGTHFEGQTPSNRSMFLGPGHAHVYFTYGSSFLLNVTSEVAGVGGGVLLRALEPLAGIEAMQKLRFYERGNPHVSGPKRLRE